MWRGVDAVAAVLCVLYYVFHCAAFGVIKDNHNDDDDDDDDENDDNF